MTTRKLPSRGKIVDVEEFLSYDHEQLDGECGYRVTIWGNCDDDKFERQLLSNPNVFRQVKFLLMCDRRFPSITIVRYKKIDDDQGRWEPVSITKDDNILRSLVNPFFKDEMLEWLDLAK